MVNKGKVTAKQPLLCCPVHCDELNSETGNVTKNGCNFEVIIVLGESNLITWTRHSVFFNWMCRPSLRVLRRRENNVLVERREWF